MNMNTWTLRRTRADTGMNSEEKLHMVLEISFSLVQLIVTLICFVLVELGVKNRFNTSVFLLVFAIVAAVFTFKYDVEVSDSSGLPAHIQPQLPIIRFICQTLAMRTKKQTAECLCWKEAASDDSKKQGPYAC